MEIKPDITTPLTQTEAGRVRTEVERIHGMKVKFRLLIDYPPSQIADALKLIWGLKVTAEDVARYAGR